MYVHKKTSATLLWKWWFCLKWIWAMWKLPLFVPFCWTREITTSSILNPYRNVGRLFFSPHSRMNTYHFFCLSTINKPSAQHFLKIGKSLFYRWSNVKTQSWTGNKRWIRWIVGRQFYLCKTVYWFPYSVDLFRSHLFILDSTIYMPIFYIEIHWIRDLVRLWREWIYW